jgi:hypothetical protein
MVCNEVCFQFGMGFAIKYAYLEGQDINRIMKFITDLYSDQPFPSTTVGVKEFDIDIAQM